jgi:glucuronoarabinoxylan endo-1,4-beta-xylanase
MKTNFSKSAGWLRAMLLPLIFGLALSPLAAMATDSTANITGTINSGNIPQVDATNFVSSASWDIFTPAPYETANTLNYTNTGTMIGSVGWEFDFGSSTIAHSFYGGPYLSANFFNGNGATIEADDSDIYNYYGYNGYYPASYVLVFATNIVNKGTLTAGANGEIVLTGTNVTLSRSAVAIAPIAPLPGGSYNNGTNFTPDTAIYSDSWKVTNVVLNTTALWFGSLGSGVFFTPSFTVDEPCGVTNVPDYITLTNITAQASLSQNIGGTNYWRQAVFVATTDPNITDRIRFLATGNPTNLFQTITVQLATTVTNVVTMLAETNAIYLLDDSASSTNGGLDINSNSSSFYSCQGNIFRPGNFIVSRTDPRDPVTGISNAFAFGISGSTSVPNNYFYAPLFSNFTNLMITATYSQNSNYIDNLAASPVGAVVTNLPGRLNIVAGNLNLYQARLGGNSEITIQADNLVSSTNAIVNCQNVSYNLGSTNGYLNVINLGNLTIRGPLHGNISLWSAVWVNATTNPVIGPGGTVIYIYPYAYNVLLVDARDLSASSDMTVGDLALHSTNMIVSDYLYVDSLLLDGQNFTLFGGLFFSGPLQDWTAAIAPGLLNFTNDGYLYIPNDAHFGDDTAAPYAEFVNNEWIYSADQTIDSLDLQINNGINETFVDNFSATARSITITGPAYFGSSISSAGDINLSANTLLIDFADLQASRTLNFSVTNSLSDNGAASYFTCYNGFNLLFFPTNGGGLLGTTVTSIALDGVEVDNYWAAPDSGPGWPAFLTNVALGTLVLSPQVDANHSPVLEQGSLFTFNGAGPGPSNALYVMNLDLSQISPLTTNYADMIQIAPNFKIYIAHANLGITLPPGQTPEQFLAGQFPAGQVVVVPDIVVPQSGTVDWDTVYQRIDGFGASCAFSGRTWAQYTADIFFSTDNNVVYSNKSLTASYTNNGIGLSLLRSEVLPGGVWSGSEVGLMQMANSYGVRNWSTPWSPTNSFTSNGSLYEGSYLGYGANATNLVYAQQLASYVYYMNDFFSIKLYALSIQNEPDYATYSEPSCLWNSQQIHDFTTNLYNAFVAAGVSSTKIMLPESANWTDHQGLAFDAMNDPNTAADVGIIANHDYVADNAVGDQTVPAVVPTYGKALWETEVATEGDAPDGSIHNAMYWATRIHLFLTVPQVNAWNYWWLITGNSDNAGLMLDGDIPTKRMFVVGQYSRFVRPNYYRVGVSTSGSGLLVSAFEETNSANFAIVAINTNVNIDISQTFNLTNFTAGSVTPWITSSSQSLAPQSSVNASSGSFTYTIPAQSVVTFVGQATSYVPVVVPPAPAQPMFTSINVSGGSGGSGGQITLVLTGPAGKTYTLLTSTNMVNWQTLYTTNPPSMPITLAFPHTSDGMRFYRIQAQTPQ